jgi:uncharacterized protein (UPF0264 family)
LGKVQWSFLPKESLTAADSGEDGQTVAGHFPLVSPFPSFNKPRWQAMSDGVGDFTHKESSAMKTAITAFLAVFVISSVGIWGCAQQKNNAQARKIRDLEARYVKLEEDYRTVVAAGENTRKKLARLEQLRQEQVQQMEELKVVVQERDDLKQKLIVRTNERDSAQTQIMQFNTMVQSFASQVQTATNAQLAPPGSNGAPVTTPSALKAN